MKVEAQNSDLDKLDRYLNSFATQSFRDQADRDYITARLACRHELFPQFLWSAHQAVEKYLKAILLYNRIKATSIGHDLTAAMALTPRLPFKFEMSERTKRLIEHLAICGEFRYLDVPYHIQGYVLIELDLAVWDIRRYCQVLYVFGKQLPTYEQAMLDRAISELAQSASTPRHKFQIQGGLLEKILKDRKHPSRSALVWQNASYGVRGRSTVRARHHLHAQNPNLYLYPEMLDELLNFVFIPKKLAAGYRAHLQNITKNPNMRP